MKVEQLISLYLEDKKDAWASTTLESERHRLNAVAKHLDGNPKTLWKAISALAPYTRQTVWTRVTSLWGWAIEEGHRAGPNAYRKWKEKNAKQFKHVYNPCLPDITYAEAEARIQGISHSGIRRKALELLYGGLRYAESDTYDAKTQRVVGKGAKPRRVYLPEVEGSAYQGTYRTFLRALKAIGLKPHMLRKLAATELAHRGGLREFDLCAAMGWSSIETAKNYVAPLKEEAMAAVFKKIQGRDKDDGEKQVPGEVRGSGQGGAAQLRAHRRLPTRRKDKGRGIRQKGSDRRRAHR